MNPSPEGFLSIGLLLAGALTLNPVLAEEAYPGLPTRSQNPLLQGYFIPAAPITTARVWSFSQALFITNTYQLDQDNDETLEIDIENTRLDLQASYRHQNWYFNSNIPLISNRSGRLDQTIESWHDIFGLPQGGRDSAVNNQLRLLYRDSDKVVIDSDHSSDGLGDIQLALGYQWSPSTQLWVSLELPTSTASGPISNDAIDAAAWLSSHSTGSSTLTHYHTLGLALPADSGLFEGRVNSRVWFGQLGMRYSWSRRYQLILQLDVHSRIVHHSDLDALDNSVQAQFGLRLLFKGHGIDLFFSEDILPGHAPDISFSLRIFPHP